MQTTCQMAEAEAKEQLAICQAEKDKAEKARQQTESELALVQAKLDGKKGQLSACENDLLGREGQIKVLEEQLAYFKGSNTSLLERLADLAIVSKSGAESIKKSLETMGEQNRYIQDLTVKMQRKDSMNLALVTNLKRSLEDVNDEDVQVEVKKGVVYISLSDKMLFKSGSAKINPRAEEILGKVAKVVNDHSEIEILVEGHTDNVPISKECIQDNWELSAKRATSVVRVLQNKHNVAPNRMTAGGRGEYVPKTTNETEGGRSINRRTEIVIIPKLDQFFQLLAPKDDNGK
ncbi:MAG: OmpA family protein [Aureispira sp.]|nr:OmpA family protein [Aureispira sp.]